MVFSLTCTRKNCEDNFFCTCVGPSEKSPNVATRMIIRMQTAVLFVGVLGVVGQVAPQHVLQVLEKGLFAKRIE